MRTVNKTAWKRGLDALNNIDNTWFQLSNELLQATGSYDVWIPCGGEIPQSVGGGADVPMVPYNPCDYGASGYWETVYYTYYYADQSDALVPKQRTKWRSHEGFANPGTPASSLQKGNISFEAGYNNSEMRYLERPENGQASQPMQYGREWMRYWVDR